MTRSLLAAAIGAVVLFSLSWLFIRTAERVSGPHVTAVPDGASAGGADGSLCAASGERDGGLAPGALMGDGESPRGPAGAASRLAAARAHEYRLRQLARSERASAGGTAASDTGPSSAATQDGGVGGGVLEGTALSSAALKALEDEDLGTLQGILISALTMDGTHFSSEDVPFLFEALASVDDFGMQKLILTHLERTEAAPQELADGYLEYLQGSGKPYHSQEVLQKLVEVGGEPSFRALSELVREPVSDKLRREAALALGELHDARSVPLLWNALYSQSDPKAARPYVDALARVGGPEAIRSLVDYASAEGHEMALGALREIRDKDAAELLAEGLNGRSSAEYQRIALSKLRSLADPRALGELERFLRGAQGPVLRQALDAVGRVQDPGAVQVLESFAARQADPKVAAQAAKLAQRLEKRLESSAGRLASARDSAGRSGKRDTWRGPGAAGQAASDLRKASKRKEDARKREKAREKDAAKVKARAEKTKKAKNAKSAASASRRARRGRV